MEEWFGGDDSKRYFFVDRTLGAVASYPDEFFAIAEVNDHHFWFGYWIRAAAEIALRDPSWATKERWGAMIDLLVADIATAERGRGDFPFLRNFDPTKGTRGPTDSVAPASTASSATTRSRRPRRSTPGSA